MVDVKERIVDDIVRRDHGAPSPLSTVQEIWNRDRSEAPFLKLRQILTT